MKKTVLLLLALFMMVSYVEAKGEKSSTKIVGFENRYDEAVTFFERGIRFHVYLNGDFDFDSRFLRTRWNGRVHIRRDFQGRINRVGNVWIRYDFRGNVRRIGRVSMSYRGGWLRRVGNLSIQYNSWGNPQYYGSVGFNDLYNDYYYTNNFTVGVNWNLGTVCPYNDPFFYGNEFRNYYRRVREDANFIYYRANRNANVSRNQVLKRRKSTSTANNGQTVRDRRRVNTQNGTNKRRVVQNGSTVNRSKPEIKRDQNRKKRVIRKPSNKRKVESKRDVDNRKRKSVKTERRSRS